MPDPTHNDKAWICGRHGTRFPTPMLDIGACEQDTDHHGIIAHLSKCCYREWRPLTPEDDTELAYADYQKIREQWPQDLGRRFP